MAAKTFHDEQYIFRWAIGLSLWSHVILLFLNTFSLDLLPNPPPPPAAYEVVFQTPPELDTANLLDAQSETEQPPTTAATVLNDGAPASASAGAAAGAAGNTKELETAFFPVPKPRTLQARSPTQNSRSTADTVAQTTPVRKPAQINRLVARANLDPIVQAEAAIDGNVPTQPSDLLDAIDNVLEQPAAETSLLDEVDTALEVTARPPPETIAASKLSAEEIVLLQQQLAKCWNFPIGAPEAELLVVEIELELRPDTSVVQMNVVDDQPDNPYFQAAIDSAIRALRNPACQPLALPRDKYAIWQKTTIEFDPQSLLGHDN